MSAMSPIVHGFMPIPGSGSLRTTIKSAKDQLPAGFPASFPSELAWQGADFISDSSYVYHLSAADISELETALDYFKTLELDAEEISPATFPLPTLGPRLSALADDLYFGKGFGLLRGLDPNAYKVEDLSLIWLGVQSHVALLRARQDKKGNMMVHIIADNSSKIASEHHRHSKSAITFHNEESGDIVSWLTRSTAKSGGRCIIASVHKVYNVLAETCPSMIRTLTKGDWPFALPTFQCRPVFYYDNNRLISNFGRAALLGNAAHPRPAHLPSLTPEKIAALDAIEAISRATQMEIQTQPGDMHFINNLNVLHRRDAFVDGDEINARRHLVRMRLRCTVRGGRIPRELEKEWVGAFGERGDRVWHIEPMPEGFFPLRSHPN